MPISHIALALLIVGIWGFNFVLITIGLQDIPPFLLACARFILTSLPAVFFIKRPSVPFKMVVFYGLVMFAIQFSLLFIGMYLGVTPGLASILLQMNVFFSILIGIIWFGERLHKWQIVGALVAFSGIVLVGMNLGGNLTLGGFILLIASAVTWSSGNAIAKKIGRVDMFALVVWGSLIAWPPLLLISLWIDGPDQILYSFLHLSLLSIGAVAYIAYLSTLFAFAVWNRLIHLHPLSTISPFTLLVPVIAMTSSVLVLGEPLESWKIYAAILVIGGLCINLFGPRIFNKKR